eukprot:CAMPEP_0171268824 /NCGR_PEP_ID=MMETSP0790-20130122/59875_1 /TAXON_ID=2925 /ORGANISM="Alexandrium catenella, Strain OF101" /LENGTH=806 /DNA_ID=CAMNT_0011737607 /DNA_START=99 /DNA_END=2519 /DNA_ORIENTATION=-
MIVMLITTLSFFAILKSTSLRETLAGWPSCGIKNYTAGDPNMRPSSAQGTADPSMRPSSAQTTAEKRKASGLGWDYTDGDPLVDCTLSCRAVPYEQLKPDADVLIVGAGLSGAILAHLDDNGLRSSMYGPHYFHTVDERVWQFLNRFSQWHYYEYRVVANVTNAKGETIFPTIPINIDTANAVFGMNIQTREEMAKWLEKTQDKYPDGPKNAEEAARARVGKVLYEKFFEGYTTKQWERSPKDLYPSVTQRIPVWSTHDDRYFNDAHQALPVKGFTELVRPMLNHKNIRYLLNTDYFKFRKHFDVKKYKKIIYTGPIDQYFADQGMEQLEYRSLTFNIVTQANVDLPDGTHKGKPWARCAVEKDRGFTGHVLRRGHFNSMGECCASCSNLRGCKWWSFSNRSECVMMSSRGGRHLNAGGYSGQRLGKTFQPATTVNQPSASVRHTRCAEYKWLPWDHKTPNAEGLTDTSLFYEYPSSTGEPYYPIPNERNVQLFKKYQVLSDQEQRKNNIWFVGRLANYKYFNMDQTTANALKIFDKMYPKTAPVVPINAQDLVVVTELHPIPRRYAASNPRIKGHWSGICRLARQIAADDQILWLIVDKGHEKGDDNVKELIKNLDLPQRSVYFYGNGAERGFDLAFEHIRRNSITGTVYLADADNAHHPHLWEQLRRRKHGHVGLLSVGVGNKGNGTVLGPHRSAGDGSAQKWDRTLLSGIAFDAKSIHAKAARSWGKKFIDGLYPAQEARSNILAGEAPPSGFECLPGPCSKSTVLVSTPKPDQGSLSPAWQQDAVDTCADIPGERFVKVVAL